MRLKVLMNLGTNEFPDNPFKAGEEQDVSDDLAKVLILRNLAVEIPLKAVPPAAPPLSVTEQPVVPVVATPKKSAKAEPTTK